VRVKHLHAVRRRGRIYYRHRRTGEPLGTDRDKAVARCIQINAELAQSKPPLPAGGSIGALIAHYRASPDFRRLAPQTQRDYERRLSWFAEHYAMDPASAIDREFARDLRDAFADRPRKADYMVQVLSVLCSFACEFPSRYGLEHNPCARIRKLWRAQDGGYKPWPANVIAAALEAAEPSLRDIILSGLYLGQRGQDDAALLWSHYDGASVAVVQAKTGKRLRVPAHPVLRARLDAKPRTAAVMFTTSTGRPWQPHNIRRVIREHMRAIGHPGYSRHGLRKNAVNALLEAGASHAEVAAVTGQSVAMVEHYAREVDQARLAENAIRKLVERG
jgi:integrase